MTEDAAAAICRGAFKAEPDKVSRFRTGSCNYVFYVELGRRRYTLRVADSRNAGALAGSLYWIDRLKGAGLPIPRIVSHDLSADPPYMICDYIEGKDLGEVYDSLSEGERREIARRLVAAQDALAELPPAQGYGYLSSYSDPGMKGSWREVVLGHLARSRARLTESRAFDPRFADRVESLVGGYGPYLDSIKPIPFFDDITTKNVLVHEGRLSGIVDLDWICFGDRLYAIALTRMSLMSMGSSLSYIDYWMEEEGAEGRAEVLDFYTLAFCLDFMSEKGLRFNKEAAPVSRAEREALVESFEALYEKADRNTAKKRDGRSPGSSAHGKPEDSDGAVRAQERRQGI
jgi:aminoglycoside phosphotransferase (APT) family kinase protein